MTEHVKQIKQFLLDRSYRKMRSGKQPDLTQLLRWKNDYEISRLYLEGMLQSEEPVIYENDIFGFNRSVASDGLCDVDGVCLYPRRPGNVTPNYNLLIDRGLDDTL